MKVYSIIKPTQIFTSNNGVLFSNGIILPRGFKLNSSGEVISMSYNKMPVNVLQVWQGAKHGYVNVSDIKLQTADKIMGMDGTVDLGNAKLYHGYSNADGASIISNDVESACGKKPHELGFLNKGKREKYEQCVADFDNKKASDILQQKLQEYKNQLSALNTADFIAAASDLVSVKNAMDAAKIKGTADADIQKSLNLPDLDYAIFKTTDFWGALKAESDKRQIDIKLYLEKSAENKLLKEGDDSNALIYWSMAILGTVGFAFSLYKEKPKLHIAGFTLSGIAVGFVAGYGLKKIFTEKSPSSSFSGINIYNALLERKKKKCPGNVYTTIDAKGNVSYECQPTL